ncbi:hypothetical protein FACS189434_13350 [Bacteroidia bacterium]|nr:hypothetical protein FACS189434_13350 [Bacteroidia bacterium]
MKKERNGILANITYFRKEKGFSQEYFAEKLGLKQSGYGMIETGERGLSYELLSQIAVELEMDVVDIITHPKKYVDGDLITQPERISVTFEISPDKRDVLLSLVTGK